MNTALRFCAAVTLLSLVASASAAPLLALTTLPGTWYGKDGSDTVGLFGQRADLGGTVFVAGRVDASKDTTILNCQSIRYSGIQGGSLVLMLESSYGVVSTSRGAATVDGSLFSAIRSADPAASAVGLNSACAVQAYAQLTSKTSQTVFVPTGSSFALSVFGQRVNFALKPDASLTLAPDIQLGP